MKNNGQTARSNQKMARFNPEDMGKSALMH